MFEIFSSGIGGFTIENFLICIGSAIVLGMIMGWVYTLEGSFSLTFVKTVAMIPAMVAIVIVLVNGSLGASVAVAGAFSLVRFRSAPGTAKEIGWVFLSMAIGLACGMGYPAFATLFTIIMCIVDVLLSKMNFGAKQAELRKTVWITIPEDLEYQSMFDDLFEKYTTKHTMTRLKTTNLGSLDKLTYDVILKKAGTEKAFMDELRQRNGNLEIVFMNQAQAAAEL